MKDEKLMDKRMSKAQAERAEEKSMSCKLFQLLGQGRTRLNHFSFLSL